MGILVPNLELASFGIVLPMAYLAISRNIVSLNPQGSMSFTLYTRYNIWSSYEAREESKNYVDSQPLSVDVGNAQTVEELYTLSYDVLKQMYPNYVDEQVFLAAAAAEPTP